MCSSISNSDMRALSSSATTASLSTVKKQKKLSMIVAAAFPNCAIGIQGNLPWRISKDLKWFKDITSLVPSDATTNNDNEEKNENRMNAVIMGRKTWLSIPEKFKPLKNRINIVLTHQLTSSNENQLRNEYKIPSEVILASSLESAINTVESNASIASSFVIGGESLFCDAFSVCDSVYLTKIYPISASAKSTISKCDAFFPNDKLSLIASGVSFKDQITNGQSYFESAAIPSEFKPSSLNEGSKFTDEAGDFQYEFLHYVRTPIITSRSNYSNEIDEATGEIHPSKKQKGETVIEKSAIASSSSRHEEHQYLDLIREIIEKGTRKGDRTGVGTLSVFGRTMRFSLKDDTMPLLTTKKTFWRGLAEELLWFISGDTSAKTLQDKNIHIWDGNGSRESLDKLGLFHREVGDLGPVYGFQWRHFGAEYGTCHDDYTGKGVDQLAELINTIKTNPNDRRMIVSAWNPAALKYMALPPCHMFAQFYVNDGYLSCQMYQRSADMGLGVPFNVSSLLFHLSKISLRAFSLCIHTNLHRLLHMLCSPI